MYAIVQVGGRQWKVEPGTTLETNRLSLEVGATHTVEQVLLARDGEQLSIGRPYVPGAAVVCEVAEHRLGPKVVSYHYRRRENWRKTHGHRQPLTKLVVKAISLGGAASAVAQMPKARSRKGACA
jgi:large subunit ribosomal protein L21